MSRPTLFHPSWRDSIWPALVIPALLFGLVAGAFPENAELPASGNSEFCQFRIVIQRNIFNPNRRKPVERREVVPPPAPPQIDQITLIGTLISEPTAFAFFAGSSPEFNSVAKRGEAVAGYTLAEIHSRGITLRDATQTLELKVSEGLERRDGGVWYTAASPFTARSSVPRSSSRSSTPVSQVDSAQTKSESPGNSNEDLMKRMMEKRRQELEK